MDFKEALKIVKNVVPGHESDEYDGIIVKRLEASNTLDGGRTTNQTHIAISGDQMNMFPHLRADGYFNCDYDERDEQLKKYFITQIPFYIYKDNVDYLSGGVQSDIVFDNHESQCVRVSIVRSRRREQADQVQLSLTTIDDPAFVAFRKLLHTGDYFVLLKRKEKLVYDCIGIKAADEAEESSRLSVLNNKFYKLPTNTKVDIKEVVEITDSEIENLSFKNTFELSDLPAFFKTDFSRRYITSLLAKPFVILTGNSGTGKTRIAKQFAEYLEKEPEEGKKNWMIVPVGADWTDNAKVLGFYNPLADNGKGNYEKTGIVRLIEQANIHLDIPYFIILDEMNLSHVERYFSDFLSRMETPDSSFDLDGYKGILQFPENLFVVGTVNIDETTYMFSPKVLDRANVVEFKPEKRDVLELFTSPVPAGKVRPANDGTAEAFLKLAKEIRSGKCSITMEDVQAVFDAIYEAVEKQGFEFAYRTVREIRQYISAAYEIADKNQKFDLLQAIDEQLLQKVLPKIHGNKKEIGKLLDELENICKQNDRNFGLSAKKIEQMKGKLANVQYASFI